MNFLFFLFVFFLTPFPPKIYTGLIIDLIKYYNIKFLCPRMMLWLHHLKIQNILGHPVVGIKRGDFDHSNPKKNNT